MSLFKLDIVHCFIFPSGIRTRYILIVRQLLNRWTLYSLQWSWCWLPQLEWAEGRCSPSRGPEIGKAYNKQLKAYSTQCDQIGRFIALWATFQSLWQQLFAQIVHNFGNFCKSVKIFHYSSEIIFGQLKWTFGNFYWSHWFHRTTLLLDWVVAGIKIIPKRSCPPFETSVNAHSREIQNLSHRVTRQLRKIRVCVLTGD